MSDPHAPHQGQSTKIISMSEVYVLSYAAAVARGFPPAACDEIAGRVLWLECRGLPGVIALTREFLNNNETAIDERGLQCPIVFGSFVADKFDELVATEPSQPNVTDGPTNGVLVLPKVAEYAEKIGKPIRVSWLMSNPPEIAAQTVVDTGTVASFGDPEALLFNTGMGFALHGEALKDGQGPDLAACEVPRQVFEPLLGFIGPERAGAAIKVHAILSADKQTHALLHTMNEADRSILAVAHQFESDQPIPLTAAPGSDNDRLWSALTRYGWTEPSNGDVCDEPAQATARHDLTNAGRFAMPLLLHALGRFPPTAH